MTPSSEKSVTITIITNGSENGLKPPEMSTGTLSEETTLQKTSFWGTAVKQQSTSYSTTASPSSETVNRGRVKTTRRTCTDSYVEKPWKTWHHRKETPNAIWWTTLLCHWWKQYITSVAWMPPLLRGERPHFALRFDDRGAYCWAKKWEPPWGPSAS
jgi:hypothetical protein